MPRDRPTPVTQTGDSCEPVPADGETMSSLLETSRPKPQRSAPTLTVVLTLIALTLWLVVLPLELVA